MINIYDIKLFLTVPFSKYGQTVNKHTHVLYSGKKYLLPEYSANNQHQIICLITRQIGCNYIIYFNKLNYFNNARQNWAIQQIQTLFVYILVYLLFTGILIGIHKCPIKIIWS